MASRWGNGLTSYDWLTLSGFQSPSRRFCIAELCYSDEPVKKIAINGILVS